MFSQKAHLTLASAAALFAFTNGALMATAYARTKARKPPPPAMESIPAKANRIASPGATPARVKIPAKVKDLRISARSSARRSTDRPRRSKPPGLSRPQRGRL